MGAELNAMAQGREDARDGGGLASLRPGDLALSEGLRDTPLGPLPETWEVVRLGDVAEFSHRPRELPSPDAVPFLPMTLIPDHDLYATRWELRSPSEVRSGVFCQEGDLLLAKITPCLENGKQGIVKGIPGGWGIATTEVFPIHSSIVFNEFLALYLKLPEVRRSLAGKMEGTTGRQRLPKAVVESLSVPLPPIAEQHAIAHALRTVQEAREATERVIAAARELKRSLMRHLFTYGPVPVARADQVELQETEIGAVPAHWQITPMERLIASGPQNGLYKHAAFYGEGTPILRIDAFEAGDILTIPPVQLKRVRLTNEELQTYALSRGDMVVNRVNGSLDILGKCALIGQNAEPVVFESNMMKFSPDVECVKHEFLLYFLCSGKAREQIRRKARVIHQASINQQDLKSILAALPGLSEQHTIAHILTTVDAKIAAEEARRGALEALFHSLLHHLMTGKIRTQGRKDAKTQSKT